MAQEAQKRKPPMYIPVDLWADIAELGTRVRKSTGEPVTDAEVARRAMRLGMKQMAKELAAK